MLKTPKPMPTTLYYMMRSFCFFIALLNLRLIALEPSLFFQKLNEPTPIWMTEQIENNLRPFKEELSKDFLDDYFARMSHQGYLTRVKVYKGKISIEISNTANSHLFTHWFVNAFVNLHDLLPLPDLDLIFSPHDIYFLSLVSMVPVFVYSKDKFEDRLILMPDMYALNGLLPDKAEIINPSIRPIWSQKHQILFFRGADNGVFNRLNWRDCPRPKLVSLSLQYPDKIDARFTNFIIYEEDPTIRNLMTKEGMLGPFVPYYKMLQYRYLMSIDGHTATTPRTSLNLYSGSVMFKQDSNRILWYYSIMKPYVHYIPVLEDLSNILDQIDWAKNNDSECNKIATNAYVLAEEVLREESVYLYLYRLLEAYAVKQREYY